MRCNDGGPVFIQTLNPVASLRTRQRRKFVGFGCVSVTSKREVTSPFIQQRLNPAYRRARAMLRRLALSAPW